MKITTVTSAIVPRPRISKRQAWGVMLALVVLSGSLYVADNLGESLEVTTRVRTLSVLIPFYVLMVATYSLAAVLWHRFSHRTGTERSFSRAVVDTGLMSLGKYVPGKVWGILLRGRRDRTLASLDRRQVGLSIAEQGFSLGAGIALAIGLYYYAWWMARTDHAGVSLAITTTSVIALAYIGIRVLGLILGLFDPSRTDSKAVRRSSLEAAVGYSLLWLLSAMPFLVLVQSGNDLSFFDFIQITTSFIVSIAAGWIAVFAPAGVGVREAVFAWSAPSFMSWTEAAYWIAAHRALMTISDLLFGLTCLLTSWTGAPEETP